MRVVVETSVSQSPGAPGIPFTGYGSSHQGDGSSGNGTPGMWQLHWAIASNGMVQTRNEEKIREVG